MKIRIRHCRVAGAVPSPSAAELTMDGAVESVLMEDEDLAAEVTTEGILKAIHGLSGHVRIGPCALCGLLAPYVDGAPFHKDIVECVLER